MRKVKANETVTYQEMQFALWVLSGTMTDREAARAAGINPASAANIKGKPRVQKYMAKHRAQVQDALVQHEVHAFVETNIDREQIIAKYWALAGLPANATNGGVIIKALNSLRDILGFTNASKLRGNGAPKPNIYQPQWLRNRRAAVKLGLDPDIFDRLESFEAASAARNSTRKEVVEGRANTHVCA